MTAENVILLFLFCGYGAYFKYIRQINASSLSLSVRISPQTQETHFSVPENFDKCYSVCPRPTLEGQQIHTIHCVADGSWASFPL